MPPKGSSKRKAAAASATSTPADLSAPQTPTLAESLSYLTYPRPFKNPAYTKNAARRTRTLKSVLSQERERERLDRERRRTEREAALTVLSTGVDATAEKEEAASEEGRSNDTPANEEEKMEVDEKLEVETDKTKLSVITEEDDIPTYTSIEAPPSILPQKRYCDITGLEAPYTDPATGLRYHDKSIYEFIKTLNASAVKEYLALRGVNPIVK